MSEAAGFLRIPDAADPLDASGVHPEAYPVVQRIVEKTGLSVNKLIGNHEVLSRLKASDYTDEQFGVPTVTDILKELEKPGRDPRPEFKTAKFQEGVHEIRDLVPGMTLEGVVSNVAAFGAFVDIGVHQDGLVHVSELSDRFVRDPREVVKWAISCVFAFLMWMWRASVSACPCEAVRRRVKPVLRQPTSAPTPTRVRFNRLPKSPSGTMGGGFCGLKSSDDELNGGQAQTVRGRLRTAAHRFLFWVCNRHIPTKAKSIDLG